MTLSLKLNSIKINYLGFNSNNASENKSFFVLIFLIFFLYIYETKPFRLIQTKNKVIAVNGLFIGDIKHMDTI